MLTKPDTARRVSTRSKKPGTDRKTFCYNPELFFWLNCFKFVFYLANLVLQQEYMFYTKKPNLDS